MPSTNILQWNPGLVNQESDAAYASDTQRSGGAAANAIFPSPTANKLFYQVSTFCYALATALVNKGYTINDNPAATLVSTLAGIWTAADFSNPVAFNGTGQPTTSLPTTSASSSVSWKQILYGTQYAIGIAASTIYAGIAMGGGPGYFSVSSFAAAGSGTPDNNAAISLGTDGSIIGPNGGTLKLVPNGTGIVKMGALKATSTVTNTGNTTLNTIYSFSLPANCMGASGSLRIKIYCVQNSGAGGPTVSVYLGSTAMAFINTGNYVGNQIVFECLIANKGATNSQYDFITLNAQATNPVLTYAQTTAVDTTGALTLTIRAQGSTNSDSITFYYATVELL